MWLLLFPGDLSCEWAGGGLHSLVVCLTSGARGWKCLGAGRAAGVPGCESAPSLPYLLCGFLETPVCISIPQGKWLEGGVASAGSGGICSVPRALLLTAVLQLRWADLAREGTPCRRQRQKWGLASGPTSSELTMGLWPEALHAPRCVPVKCTTPKALRTLRLMLRW